MRSCDMDSPPVEEDGDGRVVMVGWTVEWIVWWTVGEAVWGLGVMGGLRCDVMKAVEWMR